MRINIKNENDYALFSNIEIFNIYLYYICLIDFLEYAKIIK